ncbi:MAG: methyltransferase domain-containing protein [Dehalococcoidales bacterium]|nr:methyltransferase domain-containing protein [Dehalococcoidales bacterium]
MHGALATLLVVLGSAAAYEGGIQIKENAERHHYWRVARAYSDLAGKPLLVVGMKRHIWQPPDGDVTLDVDPLVTTVPGGVCADERSMPFSDKEFGAVYNPHTLEHLATAEDVETAVNECLRVADVAFFLAPSPYSIAANFFCPSHHLRLWFDNDSNRIVCRPSNWQTGIGFHSGPRKTGQALWACTPLKVPAIVTG